MRRLRWATLLLSTALIAAGPDDSFNFVATSPQPYTPGYLGNGAIGLETTPLGTTPAHCFLAGVYDHTPGDVPRIAAVPVWNEIDFYNGSHWLNAGTSFDNLQNYHQVLDMYDGVLRTSYLWSQDNRKISVETEEFVSRARAELAATRVVITPEFSGQIQVRMPLRNWPAPRRYLLERVEELDPDAQKNPWLIWYPGHLDVTSVDANATSRTALLSLMARAPGNGPGLAEAVSAEWRAPANVQTHKDANGAEALLTLAVKPGVRYTFTKYASILVGPKKEAQIGWDALSRESATAWHKLWGSDIIVDGDPKLQRTIHSMLFYLLASAREGLDISTPPMGLSTAGYYGHIFWDADTFMFPPLLILHPEMARPMVAFRSRTRDVARSNAKQNGFQGAMYPWEAGPDGSESTPRFAGQNAKYENHINGDVALAAWQYWVATGDRNWLQVSAWPILRDTADFWVSRVTFNAKLNRYEIGKVVSENESLIGISNDAYTNAVAKKNLDLAIAAARAMRVEPHAKWHDVAAKMYIPESDSPLLCFPLDLACTPPQIRAALDKINLRIQHHETGGMMGTEFYPILAAEIGDRTAIGKMIEPLWAPYLRPPFQAIAETPRNQNISFITGAGAFLQQCIFGYSGLRLSENGLERKFRPVLPPNVERLTLKNITIRGKRETLVFDSASK